MNEQKHSKPHVLILENREKMNISGVADVDSFNDETVVLMTDKGKLTIKGANLKVSSFAVETGDLELQGNVMALAYVGNEQKKGVFGKLF